MEKSYQGISARLNLKDYQSLKHLVEVSCYSQSGVLRALINQAASLSADEVKKLIRSEEDVPPQGPTRRKRLRPGQLLAYLKGFDVNVVEFAKGIEVGESTVFRWLDGSRNPNAANCEKIHKYLCHLVRGGNCVLSDRWKTFRIELVPKRKNGKTVH